MQKIVEKCVKTSCRILERFNVNKLNATQLNNFNFTNNEWWSLNGKFKALHSMNKLRVGLIRQLANSSTFDKQNEVFKLAESYPIKSQNFSSDLKNVNILDVGCGAGILSEPLARLGGNVIGIDSDDSAIKNAKNHILDTFINSPQYFNTKVENFLKIYLNHVKSKQNIDKPKILPSLDNHLFDFVVLSEVIEHVDDPGLLIWEASKYLKLGKNGIISETFNSYKYSTKEENERRHAWVRIFPTSTSLDQYGHFIVGKTNDFVLHRNLFGQSNNKYKNADKEKLSPCQNVSPYNNCLVGNRKIYQYYENITKRKLSFSNNVNVLNSSSIYNRTLATFDKEAYMEMCNEHHGQYIRQLKWGSRRSKPYNIKMERYADKNEGEEIQMKFKKKLNIDTSVVENKTKCMTSHKTKFIENKDSLLKETVKPLKVYTSETIQKYSIALSHVHARNAFAAYLLRIKENIQTINNCDLEKSGNLQMGLIEKFLNKVSDCDLNWKNKNLQFKEKNLSEKPMLIEKLSAYIKKYVQDTTMMNKNAKTFPKSKETFLEIDTFIREASEQDLEYLLTNYTKNLNCVNLFLSNENLIKPEKSNIKREKVNQEFVKINYQNAKIKSNKALNDSEKKFQSIKFPKKQEKSKIDLKYESKNSNKSKDRIDIITVNSPPTKSNFEAMHNLIRKNQTRYYTNKSKQKISLTFRENHKNYELGNFKQPITSLNDNVINERIKSKLNYLGISSHDTIKNYKTSFPLDFKFNLNLTNHSIKNTFKDFDNKISLSLNHCTPDIKNRQKIFLMERLKQSSRLLAESRNKHDQFINNKLKCENNDKSKQPKSSMKLTNLV
ncbi:hypothetical protein A3Q56_05620 [Intoshia linei]|uniref:Methyltransferase type 11 domain-containing protein n=1 Tax=Intoshia linei TaxID=1819745 RepID=A0A177AXA7_9BILA|nr:hypothetical protein A3Q56_05620 [Intoshia linei]